jgi:hypothetical protein
MYLSLNRLLSSQGSPTKATSVRAYFANQHRVDAENKESKVWEAERHVAALRTPPRANEDKYSREYREKAERAAREFFGCENPSSENVDRALLSEKCNLTTVLAMGGNYEDLDVAENFCATHENGLVYTMLQAYTHHRVLVLRPDDFTHHMCLVTAIWMGSEENAEAVRSKFVDHQGKKALSVFLNRIEEFPGAFRDAIDGALKHNGELTQVLTPTFSTTTPDDVQFANVALMCVFKHYFEYYMTVLCGLRGVRLQGTIQDWEALKEKYEALKRILPEMQHWYTKMDFVVDLLVRTAKGHEGVGEDWNNMAQLKEARDGYGKRYSLFNGWVLALDPFDAEGRPRDMEEERVHFTQTRASCDVQVSGLTPTPFQARAYVSLAGFLYSSQEDSVKPLAVWWLAGPARVAHTRWQRAALEEARRAVDPESVRKEEELDQRLQMEDAFGTGVCSRWCVIPCLARCLLPCLERWFGEK